LTLYGEGLNLRLRVLHSQVMKYTSDADIRNLFGLHSAATLMHLCHDLAVGQTSGIGPSPPWAIS
jgi:hypothetical protein